MANIFVCQSDNGYKGVYTIDGEEILPLEFDEILYNEFTGGPISGKKGG